MKNKITKLKLVTNDGIVISHRDVTVDPYQSIAHTRCSSILDFFAADARHKGVRIISYQIVDMTIVCTVQYLK